MFFQEYRTFLFKCFKCESILAVDFDDKEEIKKVQQKKAIVDCPCGHKCYVLLD